jgi:hypothetical protein
MLGGGVSISISEKADVDTVPDRQGVHVVAVRGPAVIELDLLR